MNRFILAEASKCTECNACMAACSHVHQEQGLLEQPRLVVTRNNGSTAPTSCRHCEGMPCAYVCPVHAISVVDQSVRVNESTCIGCKLCGLACPFGAITPAAGKPVGHPDVYEYDIPESELSNSKDNSGFPFLAWKAGQRVIAVKCDLCYFRNEGPACVQACPNSALQLITKTDIEELKKTQRLRLLRQMPVELAAEAPTDVKDSEVQNG